MAQFKHREFLNGPYDGPAWDELRRPGTITPFSGIYRCRNCGDEIASNQGNPLPPQNHHQHNPPAPILWQLIVATETY